MVSEVGWKISSNNLNWTSERGESDVRGLEVAWRWAAAVRLSMCFGFPLSGLVHVARICVRLT